MRTISASRLQCWQQCRLKFLFRYVLALVKPSTPPLHIGKTVHAVLQAWSLARWRKEPFKLETFRQLFESDWKERQSDTVINWEGEEEKQQGLAWAVLENYFIETPIQADERPEAVEVVVEADLVSHGLPKLVGIIDLVRAGGIVVDFKTTGKTPDAEQVTHLHETQLSCYSVLYRDATGRKEAGLELHHLVKTKQPKLVVTQVAPMSDKQQSRLFRAIESYLQGLERQDFVPSPGMTCLSCEYFGECRRWGGTHG